MPLNKTYVSGGWLKKARGTVAAKDVSLDLRPGETVGIVGESGSGKSTVARYITRLIDPTSGEMRLGRGGGTQLDSVHRDRLKLARKRIQIVFQDLIARSTRVSVSARQSSRARSISVCHARQAALWRARTDDSGAVVTGRTFALSQRVLGRPATAHQHRPRARA